MAYWFLTLMTFFCHQNKIQAIFEGPQTYIIWLLPTSVTSSPTTLPFDCIFLLAIYSSLCLEYFPSDFSDRITPTDFLKLQLCEAFSQALFSARYALAQYLSFPWSKLDFTSALLYFLFFLPKRVFPQEVFMDAPFLSFMYQPKCHFLRDLLWPCKVK